MTARSLLTDRRDSVTARPWRRPGWNGSSPVTSLAYRIAAAVLALVLWQVAVVSGLVSDAAVATPTDIAQEAAPLLATPAFGAALFDTVTSWAEGLLVSLVIAIPVGLALGTSDLAYR